MCGIVGWLAAAGFATEPAESLVNAMVRQLHHRGPDDQGSWVDAPAGVAFGHRRLSILDLSPSGHQPMISRSSRYVIVLNGEIYNHLEIRSQLDGQVFRGRSDTETLLAAVERWGVEGAVSRSVGMFAFAVWDAQERVLTLCRDRLGEKPLYFGATDRAIIFASELKALRLHPDFPGSVDPDAVTLYLDRGYVPAPLSIYRGIGKMPPGSLMEARAVGGRMVVSSPREYWSLANAFEHGCQNPFTGSLDDAADEIERLLGSAIELQSIADVPLGAFLSGGVDSSMVVALMQRHATRSTSTFTIGFENVDADESRYADRVARHLGTEHHRLVISEPNAVESIPTMSGMYDEPFGDSSQIPMAFVARLARSRVTVALSGDAGDELFGGYDHYRMHPALWNRIVAVPQCVRRLAAGAILALPTRALEVVGLAVVGIRGRRMTVPPSDRLRALASAARARDDIGFSLQFGRQLPTLRDRRSGDEARRQYERRLSATAAGTGCRSLVQRMMLLDALSYLPDDILVKVDRAAMAVGLEARVPMLDHRFVEFSTTLPAEMKISGGVGKVALRHVLRRHLPTEIVDRPKAGFTPPVAAWLRHRLLRDWVESLLDPRTLEDVPFLDPAVVRSRWNQHLAGTYEWHGFLWPLLMFLDWRRVNQGVRAAVS